MSQRNSNEGHRLTHEPGTNFTSSYSHPQRAFTTGASPSTQRHSQLPPPPPPPQPGSRLELPPLLRVPGTLSDSSSPSIPRSVTLPSVLNPLPHDPVGQRRRKADELTSPHSSVTTLPPLLNAQNGPRSSGAGRSSMLSHLTKSADHTDRRMLTPKSPIRRAISLSQLNPSSGSINAHQNPFPTSPHPRSYQIEPGTAGAPPLPNPSAGMRHGGYEYTNMIPPPNDSASRPSPGVPRYSQSPSPGYSNYDQDEKSPDGYSMYDQSALGYLAVEDHSRSGGRGASVSPSVGTSDYNAAAGQSTYQMMTLKTTEGDVRFPVDVQAASRVADEKRKRNAGASARFRERRKKKEMEAATTISKLEQRIKDMSEDATFYKTERDVLAGIVRSISGGDRHLLGRPTSPRLRRTRDGPSASAQTAPTTSYTTHTETAPGSPQIERNVRRRTSSFSAPQAQQPMARPYEQEREHQVRQPGYAPPPPHIHMSHQQHSMTLQPPTSYSLPHASQLSGYSSRSSSGIPPPPSVLQAPPMTGPYNPFASRYDQSDSHRPSHGR